jgi:hypothetical protein
MYDRNNPASMVVPIDDYWFYTEILGRINFSDIEASPILRHPAGYHHFGCILPGFGTPISCSNTAQSGVHADDPTLPPGDVKRSFYDMFLNWILNGAPYN